MTPEAKTPGGKQPCPHCGKPASGNFCQHCGGALGGRACAQCGAKLSGAAKFCTQCGAPAAGARAGGASKRAPAGGVGAAPRHREAAAATFGGGNAPWWVAGAAMFILILVVGWNMVKPAGPVAPAGGMPGGNPAAGGSALDLNNMSPREAADRLFNRVMEAMSQGDTTGALFFQPMAVQAYERAEPLDLDGVLHQSLLEALSDPAAGLATAQRILEPEPDHVLGLGAAAQAAIALGDSAQAATYYQRLLAVYDVQYARNLAEYDGHRTLMAEMRSDAQRFLASP